MTQENMISYKKYFTSSYVDKDRWVSYYWQSKLVMENTLEKGSVLEVGLGNGLVANYLQGLNFNIKTADINESLKPDFVCSVENLTGINDRSFDTILCAEVLEHLSFEKFGVCLQSLKRVAKGSIIISLPYWGYTFGCKIKKPIFGTHQFKFKISGFKKHRSIKQHYWELGKRGYGTRKIKKIIKQQGFKIEKSFWDIDDPYHYYIVCKLSAN